MTPNQLYPLLKRHWDDPVLRRRSIYLEGPSGIGKSEIVQALGEEANAELRDKRMSQMDAVDFSGTPRDKDGWTRFSPPEWLRFEDGKPAILFADEITSATREVHSASYQLFLERRVGDVKIPDSVMIIAAGNRLSDRGVVNQIPAPLLNRFVKLTIEPHLDSWLDWAATKGVDPRMLSWVGSQAQYLHNFDAGQAAGSEPFSTPRSIVSAATYIDWPKAERVELLRGTIGKEAADSLESHLRLWGRLPAFDEVVSDPEGCRIPATNELGERYAVSMMCAMRMDRQTFGALWRYVDRLGSVLCVLAVRLAQKRDPSLATAKGYRDFATKHRAVFERA